MPFQYGANIKLANLASSKIINFKSEENVYSPAGSVGKPSKVTLKDDCSKWKVFLRSLLACLLSHLVSQTIWGCAESI